MGDTSLTKGLQYKFDMLNDSMSNTRANLLKIVMNNRHLQQKSQAKILVIGLSGAGKSTLLQFIDRGASIKKQRSPTLAFTRYLIDFGKLQIVFIDAPGQQSYWPQWNKYLPHADAILFMMDASNFIKVGTVNRLIYDHLKLHQLTTPTLFLANKQDLESAIKAESIAKLLHLADRMPHAEIYPISAINGAGMIDAFKWMLEQVTPAIRRAN